MMSDRIESAYEFYRTLASGLDQIYEVDVVSDRPAMTLLSLTERANHYHDILQDQAHAQEKDTMERDYRFFLSMIGECSSGTGLESLRSHYKEPESLSIYAMLGMYGLLMRVQNKE